MRQFEVTEAFRDEFRHAARRYLARLGKAREKIESARLIRECSKDPLNDWRVELADALAHRDSDRVGRAEGRLTRLIRSITGGDAIPEVMIADDPIQAAPGFAEVVVEGHIFALISINGGESFICRPAWLQVE